MFYQSWLDDLYLLLYLSSEQTGVGHGWVDLKENLSYSSPAPRQQSFNALFLSNLKINGENVQQI